MIVGAVVGSILFILILVATYLLLRRRRKRYTASTKPDEYPSTHVTTTATREKEIIRQSRLSYLAENTAETTLNPFSPSTSSTSTIPRKRPPVIPSSAGTAVEAEEPSPAEGARVERVYHSDGGQIRVEEYPPAYGAYLASP